jgi:hypothetical protein
MTETHKTLNDPPWGPAPLSKDARRLLERLRDRGPFPVPGAGPSTLPAHLARLGYIRPGPRQGWFEITMNGVLALTPLE